MKRVLFFLFFFFPFFFFFSRASDEWLPRKPKKIFVVWRFAMSVYVTNRLMKKDNAIVCRYASKYNLLILLLVCWRPKIESADRPLNTGSTSNQQDFPDKRLIKSFIPSVFVRASMVQMSPSCELTYYVSVLCSFISVGIPHVLSLRPLLYCLPPPRRRRGLRLNNATWIPYYVHLPEMVWAVKIISIIGSVELDIGVCSSFPLLTLPRPHPLSPSLSHLTLSLSLTVSRSLLRKTTGSEEAQ